MNTDHEFAIPGGGQSSDSQKMTNDDFRKLMMTPRSSGPATLGALGSGSATPTLHSLTPKDEKGNNILTSHTVHSMLSGI